MQRKLKAVFRSSSKKKATDQVDQTSPSTSPRVDRRATSLEERSRPLTSDSSQGVAQPASRSRPLSSVYDSRRVSNASGPQSVAVDYAQHRSSEAANEAIANDYKAYLPALSPVEDSYDDQYMTLGGDRRLITGESDGRHEEDVADRNIDRYRTSLDVSKRKPLPATPDVSMTNQDVLRKNSGAASFGSTISSVPSAATGKYSVGGDMITKGGLKDRILPHKESTPHEKNQWKQAGFATRTAREESRLDWSRRRPRGSQSGDEAPQLPPADPRDHPLVSLPLKNRSSNAMTGNADGQHDIERQIEQLLDGVVDLRNTVDEDKEVQYAPAVTHEIVKPHEHEIIQHKVYREIHNYDYYHYTQPVYDIQVLPPRHWIPNPDGPGLVEISADELPSRTGANRRWKIVHEEIEQSVQTRPSWRTEPEIIEHPTTVTEEGFERKDTTIIYPPKLQDLTDYDGLVQPVHFDHKTGKRWLGEISTMHQLRKELGQVVDPDSLDMKDLAENLPYVPEVNDVPELSKSTSITRKPVNGSASARFGQLGARAGIAY
ncbi:hypothetical protein FB567DRAFT_35792 [Paraphoma chrysanthemicola]|uniref:Uncharacterized protein n=1 Tax=Paraphoma chrysanthemicola TaxID=798071 RepID=A0A8K0W4T6_9PLEO|nr:hypothetical protein FB567DRAFT_35792 [Paraphoma chrysanthemicola]